MLKNYFKYLNISDVEERWGIYVTTVGHSKTEPNDRYPNQVHPESHHLTWNRGRTLNDYYIVFISKGKGVYGSALTQPTAVTEGTSFFLYPGVWHRYKPDPGSGWEEFWVGFNGFYVMQLMGNGFFDRQSPMVPLGLNKDMLVLFRNLIEAVRTSLPGYPQQIAAITLQMLALVNNVIAHHEYNDDPVGKLISKAKFIIQESFEDTLHMEKLAQALPMGYSSFRKALGVSPANRPINITLTFAWKGPKTCLPPPF